MLDIFAVKSPLLAYNSFVEAIFVLNDCAAHGGRSGSQGSLVERRLFSIRFVGIHLTLVETNANICTLFATVFYWLYDCRGTDEASRSKRMHIYNSLLKQMAPEHRLATFAKVCAEILAGVTDGMLNIDDQASQSVLQV